jgi:hypothetical protein|nr:MAG TPA: hypothetical protein [Bacteriophage sp.]
MTREEFEKKIDELAKTEEHGEFAKTTGQIYGLLCNYVLSTFEDVEDGWEKVVSSLVKK